MGLLPHKSHEKDPPVWSNSRIIRQSPSRIMLLSCKLMHIWSPTNKVLSSYARGLQYPLLPEYPMIMDPSSLWRMPPYTSHFLHSAYRTIKVKFHPAPWWTGSTIQVASYELGVDIKILNYVPLVNEVRGFIEHWMGWLAKINWFLTFHIYREMV